MGLVASRAGVAPQQELPRERTRSAAWPYFSFTAPFTSISVMAWLLCAAGDLLGLNGFAAGAALGVEKRQQLPQGLGIRRVTKIGALATHADQLLVLELVQVMGERGSGDAEFAADFVDDHAVRMRAEQQAHDPQPRLHPHRREHVRVTGDLSF